MPAEVWKDGSDKVIFVVQFVSNHHQFPEAADVATLRLLRVFSTHD